MKKFLMITLLAVSGHAMAAKTLGQSNSQKCDCVECKKQGWCVETHYDSNRGMNVKTRTRINNKAAAKSKVKSE